MVRAADGAVVRIVEHKDATPAERALGEVNAGIYCVDARSCGGPWGTSTTVTRRGSST